VISLSASRARRLTLAVSAAVLSIGVLAAPAGATWSIVAVDPDTGDVGAALASCVPAEILGSPDQPLVPIILVPGKLAAVTQGQLNLDVPERVQELAAAGVGPADIVDDLTSPAFDEAASARQHAIASTAGVAAFSGDQLQPEALDRQGPYASAQGNLLASPEVVDAALAAFDSAITADDSLADALVAGLQAGSGEGGDRRCPDQSALFAQVVVARPGDDPAQPATLLTVTVNQGDGQNPVTVLADAMADGRSGLIDARRRDGGGGTLVQVVVLVMATLLGLAGFLAFRRGMGSTRARR